MKIAKWNLMNLRNIESAWVSTGVCQRMRHLTAALIATQMKLRRYKIMKITNMEHDGCCGCKYEELMEYEKPCVNCKGTVRPSNEKYDTTPDLYEPIDAEPVKDLIHHPAHYCYSEYEPKDVIRAWGLNFNLGSAVKYIARAGRKDDIVQELSKAKQFIEFEIEAIEKERAQ